MEASKVLFGIKKIKVLGRAIKIDRTPAWPCLPTVDLPPKDISDVLVEGYLRTSETIYRILHVPTFREAYESLWVADTKPNMAFLVQVKLVLAIGAVTYDESFSLRSSALRWVYEAQTWLSEPNFKSSLGIQSLQTSLLLLVAQETMDINGDSVWSAVGALLRRAIYMGLHKDPSYLPNMTVFAAEMRRRVWNTIIELVLQSSLNSGGPPLISLPDFDIQPPANFDDEQLLSGNPSPQPADVFTQTSVAIALRKTLPIRLAIAKHLNDLCSHGTYEETLRLDSELRTSHKTLYQSLQNCHSSSTRSVSHFERRVLDFIMHRYLCALHMPFFSPSLRDTSCAFSRKMVVETSLKIWYSICPPASIPTVSPGTGLEQTDLERLVICGRGFYRIVHWQAAVLVAVELRTQLQEEQSLGPVLLRPDLLSVLKDAEAWCLRSIEVGETNVKGYLLICLVNAEIGGLMRGLGKDELRASLVKAAEDSEDRCLPILEAMAAHGQIGETAETTENAFNMPEDMENWDLMVCKERLPWP
jgi:hypothetical protein